MDKILPQLEVILVSTEIGAYLKEAREALGLTLEQLQEMTKIQQSFIIAIEKGEFQKLPSPFYVRTYLRSYANCVKVEPHHILRQYRKEEQAERGLTGAHKIVDENAIQQSSPLEHKLANENKNRITTNMALTIAQPRDVKVPTEPLHTDRLLKETARRNAGYQGVTSSHKYLSKTKLPSQSKQPDGWDVEQDILTWGTSDQLQAMQTMPLSRQATARLSIPHQNGLALSESGMPSKRTRTGKKSKGSNRLFTMGIWASIVTGLSGIIYLLHKLKYF